MSVKDVLAAVAKQMPEAQSLGDSPLAPEQAVYFVEVNDGTMRGVPGTVEAHNLDEPSSTLGPATTPLETVP